MRTLFLTTGAALFMLVPSSAIADDINIDGEVRTEMRSAQATPETERVSVQTFEVSYEGGKNESLNEVLDEALYMAAQKTLDYDYDWFRIKERDTEKDKIETRNRAGIETGFETVPVRECGLLGCSTRYRTYYRGYVGNDFRERDDALYTVTLEFEMGTGRVIDDHKVYDARVVTRTYEK